MAQKFFFLTLIIYLFYYTEVLNDIGTHEANH